MISMNWVSDYVDIIGEDLKELAVKITKSGVNVEKVITNKIDNLVVGQIKKVDKHPDSDHLNVCMVDIGNSVVQIVCGASNVKEGLKVIVALPGAVLPGNFEIKKGKIRGEESNGMICALFELGLEEKTEEVYAKGITELASDAKVGTDPLAYLGLDDTVYELDIHKHRNNDCFYHIGFAYIVASVLNKKVTLPSIELHEIKENINNYFKLDVKTDACPYYTAKMVRGVKIGESPDFIKKRLISAGMRPINNVVDISNYVMLEYGQPLHFFDKDKLGDKILVRMACDNEPIRTLDGKERVLTSNDIVITDGVKPVAIAGVMGAENTDVDDNTKNILINIYNNNDTNYKIYLSTRLGLWSKSFIKKPDTNELKIINCDDKKQQGIINAFFNSSTFYFLWILLSDCWHITSNDILNINFNYDVLTEEEQLKLYNLAFKLERDLEKNKKYIGSKQVEYEYKHKYSKKIIDEIDKLIANVYGLTEEEINYIINFAYKYRMNDTAEEE